MFYEGMYISGEVYFKYDKSFILLCRDVTITSALLTKFYETEWGNKELYVQKEHLKDILVLSEQFSQLYAERGEERPVMEKPTKDLSQISEMMELTAKINLFNDYQDLRGKLETLMDKVDKEGTISMDVPDRLSEEINQKIELTDPALLIECINSMRSPDNYLNSHSVNVAMLNGMIGTWLKLPQAEIDILIKTGLLHDMGKLRVPLEILNKPGPLDDREFAEMKKHSVYSYEILKLSGETDNRILEGTLSHHERINGSGYPSGLQITQISLYARITAVSDVYDAMVAKRVYKDSHSPFEILDEFAFHKFSNLDIGIVNVFLEKMPTALLGKSVLLSDGRTAKVSYINPQNFSYPIVEFEGKLLSTGPGLHCVAMDNFLAAVDD
jgi:HD-GYP domain-containing protein (c-di-GMP phosphodiesterase class II)